MEEPIKPKVVTDPPVVEPKDKPDDESPVSEPTKLIRIATMTRAMLDEVRQAPLDEGGRARLAEVHSRSVAELRDGLSTELLEEFDEIMIPLEVEGVTEAELRIAQAQLIGWLEGLFHGIQASLWSQQMAAQSQLAEMQRRALNAPKTEQGDRSGLYL